jgi:transcriptional/translational regulatory protein YebC/TACO1
MVPGGVAILVETMTDNRNRTVSDVRHAFSKFGGNLGTDGSVAYLFKKLGLIHISKDFSDEKLMDLVIESGAIDYTEEEEFFEVITDANNFNDVLEIFKKNELSILMHN